MYIYVYAIIYEINCQGQDDIMTCAMWIWIWDLTNFPTLLTLPSSILMKKFGLGDVLLSLRSLLHTVFNLSSHAGRFYK